MKRSSRFDSMRFHINNRMMWIIASITFFAAFLFGSNRPVFWLLWSLVLAVSGVWWFFSMASSNAKLRVSIGDIRWILVGFLVLAAFMLIQILPIGSMAPAAYSSAEPEKAITLGSISLTPGDTLLALVRWLSYGLMFFFVLQIAANQNRARTLLNLVFWGTVIHAAFSIVFLYQLGDTIFGIQKWSYEGSATGGFVNRNSFATFLAFGSVLGVIQIIQKMTVQPVEGAPKSSFFDIYLDKGGVLPIAIGWLIIVIALIASNSRMGTFAACCGMFFVLALAIGKVPAGARVRGLWLVLAVVPATIGMSIVLYGTTFMERLGRLEGSEDVDVRLDLYRQALEMIQARPLLGFGGNSFEYAYPLFHAAPVNFDRVWDKAHSTYLALWSEYGLIFGSIPILIVTVIFFRLLLTYISSVKPEPTVLAALGVILVGAIHSLVDFSLEIEAVTFIFVTIVAAGYAREHETRRPGVESSS